jgi:hypothetical protein
MIKLKLAALWVFCLGFPLALWEWHRIVPGSIVDSPKVTYAELVTIILTGLTVALALFASIAGVLAIWGYSNIKTEAAAAAHGAVEASVKTAVGKHLNDEALGATIRRELRPLVREVIREEMPPDLIAGLYPAAFPQAPEEAAVPTEPIAEQLPGENNEAR